MQDELVAEGLLLGVARAEPYAETERLIAERRARGLFGDLRFTLTNTPRSCHPERLVRGARSVIAAAMPLWRPAAPRPEEPAGRMPRYAWSDPYTPLRERLTGLADRLRARGARCAVFVDSNHHVDRDAAVRAGLAFSGRNTMAIVPGEGSFVALGAIVTDAELEPAEDLVPPGCGSCTLCLDACPTDALDRARACSTRRAACRRRRRRAGRCPPTTPPRSRTASTAATSARTCARGTPARPGAAQSCPKTRARGCHWPTGSSCRARSCWRAMRTSTCRSAIPATCAATRSSRSATRPAEQRELARLYADDPDPLLRDAARRALTG